MSKKRKIVLEFTFKDDEDDYPELVRIERTHSDLTDGEIDNLGEDIAQSDYWQVYRWIDIQTVLGNSGQTKVKFS